MKTVRTKRDVRSLELGEHAIRVNCYLTLPLVETITRVVPNLESLYIAKTNKKSSKAVKLLKAQGVRIVETSKRGPTPKHNLQLAKKIRKLAVSGVSYGKIAKELGLEKSTVHYIVKKRKLGLENS
jgi:hypothetical protein